MLLKIRRKSGGGSGWMETMGVSIVDIDVDMGTERRPDWVYRFWVVNRYELWG